MKELDMSNDDILFQETQRFRQAWLLVLVIGPLLVVAGVYGYGIISQLVYDEPFGDEPMSDTALVISGLAAILFCLAVVVLFVISGLETRVGRDGLYVRFYPFHLRQRKIPLEKVASFRAVTYRPIWDYGGWGLRCGRGGRAYNASGRRGVRLEFYDGKHLLIGSQRPEELAAAIESLLRSQGWKP